MLYKSYNVVASIEAPVPRSQDVKDEKLAVQVEAAHHPATRDREQRIEVSPLHFLPMVNENEDQR